MPYTYKTCKNYILGPGIIYYRLFQVAIIIIKLLIVYEIVHIKNKVKF